MALVIEDSLLSQIHFSENELRIEIAFYLYQQNKLTLSNASKLANIDRIQFQKKLQARKIPINYSALELEQDFETINHFNE